MKVKFFKLDREVNCFDRADRFDVDTEIGKNIEGDMCTVMLTRQTFNIVKSFDSPFCTDDNSLNEQLNSIIESHKFLRGENLRLREIIRCLEEDVRECEARMQSVKDILS